MDKMQVFFVGTIGMFLFTLVGGCIGGGLGAWVGAGIGVGVFTWAANKVMEEV